MKKFIYLLESLIENNYKKISANVFYINNITENEFNSFNKDNLYTLLKPSEIRYNKKIYSKVIDKEKIDNVICSTGIVSFYDMFINVIYHHDSLPAEYKPNEKGIAFFKKRKLDLVKKYDSIKDLNNPNVGLFVEKRDKKFIIIGYEIDKITSRYYAVGKKSILFYCLISKDEKMPFDGSKVILTVSRRDVNGQKIMYPFAIYFADNSILISDRSSVSQLAKKVWKDFYSLENVLYPYAPIDNILFPITPQKEDDGQVFSTIKNDLESIIVEIFKGKEKTFLLKILDSKNKQDLLKIEDQLPENIKSLVKNLYDLNKNIDESIIYKFLYDLFIEKFKIDLGEIRKAKYLDWAYKINPSVKNNIKEIVDGLIDNHLKADIKDKNSKILNYAKDLWNSA